MPYGFIKHLEDKGCRLETIKSYEKVVTQFLKYLKITYSFNKEPFQITPSDIKNYLQEQLKRGKNISTINKELVILKTLFHYLWEINKVPIDPAVKLKRFKVENGLKVEVSFEKYLLYWKRY